MEQCHTSAAVIGWGDGGCTTRATSLTPPLASFRERLARVISHLLSPRHVLNAFLQVSCSKHTMSRTMEQMEQLIGHALAQVDVVEKATNEVDAKQHATSQLMQALLTQLNTLRKHVSMSSRNGSLSSTHCKHVSMSWNVSQGTRETVRARQRSRTS